MEKESCNTVVSGIAQVVFAGLIFSSAAVCQFGTNG